MGVVVRYSLLALLVSLFSQALGETPSIINAAEEPAAEAPATGTSLEVAHYQAILKEWKQVLGELSSMQAAYGSASAKERAALEQRFRASIGKANYLAPKFKAAAEAAFMAEKGKNKELGEMLLGLALNASQIDDYEEGARLAAILREYNYESPLLPTASGIAAFMTNDFVNAEKWLTEAEATKKLSQNGIDYLKRVKDYQKMWAREEKLRAAEAKADDLPRVQLETTKGTIILELFENEAPNTVANFITLVEKKFYDGTKFHRVIMNFMAQGGDPTGTGTGGPGYNIPGEATREGYREHFRGTLSMAHSGDPDSGGSQFFLTFVPTQHLDGKHTAFGRVIEGMNVLPNIQRIDPQRRTSVEADRIIKATVIRKRPHAYTFKKTGE